VSAPSEFASVRQEGEVRPPEGQSRLPNLVGIPFKINDQEVAGAPSVLPVFYGDGSFSVLWASHQVIADRGALLARRFGTDALPTGASVALRSGPALGLSAPAAVALPSGNTWALWEETGQFQDPDGVFSGVFDSSWALKTPVSRVNTYTEDKGRNSAGKCDVHPIT
jgi:hypothetical protein